MELDEPVDGLGATVGGSAGVEVGQERVLPLSEGAAEPGDFGDGAGGEVADDLFGELAALVGVGVGVRGPEPVGRR